jgi:hypothetical protein
VKRWRRLKLLGPRSNMLFPWPRVATYVILPCLAILSINRNKNLNLEFLYPIITEVYRGVLLSLCTKTQQVKKVVWLVTVFIIMSKCRLKTCVPVSSFHSV